MVDSAIRLTNVSVSYAHRNTPVVSHVTLDIPYGSFTLITGESGSGKSTLLSAITGLLFHDERVQIEGDVVVGGLPVSEESLADVAERVGSIWQNPDSQIIYNLVEDEIAFGCENVGMPVSDIQQIICEETERLALSRHARAPQLSGGQKARLVVAATLSMRRKIIVLDEPLANLDAYGAQRVLQVLHDLSLQGYAVVIAEHRISLVAPLITHAYRINNGRVDDITRQCRGSFAQRQCADESSLSSNAASNKCSPSDEAYAAQLSPDKFADADIGDNVEVHKDFAVTSKQCARNSEVLSAIQRFMNNTNKQWYDAKRQLSRCTNVDNNIADNLIDHHESDRSPMIAIRNLAYRVHGSDILDIGKLDIYPNERIILAGDNGCGKSTLLSILAGITRPSHGSIYYHLVLSASQTQKSCLPVANGQNNSIGTSYYEDYDLHFGSAQNVVQRLVQRITSRRKRANIFASMSYVWQNPQYQLFASSVYDEIALRNDSRALIEDVAQALALTSCLNQHPLTLSEGQKRRLSIACAFVTQPHIALFDEPFAGQDVDNVKRIQTLCKSEQYMAEDATVIMATHDFRDLEDYVTRIIVIDHGNIAHDFRINPQS